MEEIRRSNVSLQFIWSIRCNLRAEGDKLRAESNKLLAEGDKLRAESNKLLAEGNNLRAEGDKLWAESVFEACGNIRLHWEWKKNNEHRCSLDTGEVFEYKP